MNLSILNKVREIVSWIRQPKNFNAILALGLIISAFFPLRYEVFGQNATHSSEFGRNLIYLSDLIVLLILFRLRKRFFFLFGIFGTILAISLLHMQQRWSLTTTIPMILIAFRFLAYPLAILSAGEMARKLKPYFAPTVIFLGSLVSLLALYQFLAGSSLGIPYIEPIISHAFPNVAKLPFHMERMLRGYGTFLHPNILGFAISVLLILSISLINKAKIYIFALPLLATGLIVSFSRSSWIALLIALLIYFTISLYYSRSKLLHVKQFLVIISVFLTICLIFYPYIQARNRSSEQTIIDRAQFSRRFAQTWNSQPIIGAFGGYIQKQISEKPGQESWKYDYPHNYWFSVISEFGLLGIAFLIWIFARFLLASLKRLKQKLHMEHAGQGWVALLVLIVILSAFDHYLLTSVQAQLVLWLSLGAFISWSREETTSYDKPFSAIS